MIYYFKINIFTFKVVKKKLFRNKLAAQVNMIIYHF